MQNVQMKDRESLSSPIEGNSRQSEREKLPKHFHPNNVSSICWNAKKDYAAKVKPMVHKDMNPALASQSPDLEILEILRATAHDIRGPLINLAAGLKLISKGSVGALEPDMKEALEKLFIVSTNLIGTLDDSVGRAECLIDGASDFYDDVDLKTDVIDPVLKEVSKEMQERCAMFYNAFEYAISEELFVRGGRFWLKFVFRNLIRNALKYGGEGVKIAIGFKAYEKWAQITIYNSGKPVSEQDRNKLFTRFIRLEANPQKKSNGLGLGLHLVKEVIQKYGGDIWYEPKRHGSSFVFTIPRSR